LLYKDGNWQMLSATLMLSQSPSHMR